MKGARKVQELFVELAKVALLHHKDEVQTGPVTNSLVIRDSFWLQGEAADAYFEKIEEASRLIEKDPNWSKATVDEIFAERLSAVLANPTEETLRVESTKLLKQLGDTPRSWESNVSIFGLKNDVDKLDFGLISLYPHIFKSKHYFGPIVKSGQPMALHMARVKVTAMDVSTAKLRRELLIERHLSVLNALLTSGQPSIHILSQRYVLPTDLGLEHVLSNNGEITLQNSQRLWVAISKSELEKRLTLGLASKIGVFLQQETEVGDRILTAYEFAGNACVERTPHRAFLLFAIALESAVLGKDTHQELSHQLAYRTAHLIGSSVEARSSIVRRIKSLYGTRSAIVHSGSKNVSELDLKEIRILCLMTLHAFVASDELSGFEHTKQLEEWFQARLLG